MLDAAIFCLALNVYNEARGEDFKGQVAVAQVTLNRANHQPKNVCKAVYEPHQFSWTDEHKPLPRQSGPEWNKARMIAILSLHQVLQDPTNGATYYHATRVDPWWRQYVRRTVRIGRHIFYRQK